MSVKIREAGAWVDVTSFTLNTHSFTGTAAPTLTVRPDSSALVVGDQFTDTTTSALYFWDGTTWTVFASSSSSNTHSFTGPGTPGGNMTARPDGTALLEGDSYLDTDQLPSVVQYIYSGGNWNLAEPAHTYIGTSHPSSSPYATSTVGKMYVNTSNKDHFYHNGTAWVLIGPAEMQVDDISAMGFPTKRLNGIDNPLEGDVCTDSIYIRSYYFCEGAYRSFGPYQFVQGTTPPASLTVENDTWINTNTLTQFVYYNSGSGANWVQVL